MRCSERRVLFVFLIVLGLLGTFQASFAATDKIDGDIIGAPATYVVQEEDNLYDIARRFDLGIADLRAANPDVDIWLPGEGTKLVLPIMHVLPPAERKGIVINLAELRLYYFPNPEIAMTYPLGIGQEGWQTPVGHTTIIRKQKDPVWIPPPSIRRDEPDLPAVFLPGPDNPLGAFALYLGWQGYRIHGTNHPYGIGWRSSHGCMRLYPEDIAELFPVIPIGARVIVVDTPYKLGWNAKGLWLEIAPTQKQADALADDKQPPAADIPGLHKSIAQFAGDAADDIDWDAVETAAAHPSGVPVLILSRDE
jgi:L,D-transpeptidase ErfK/SrfK